MFHLEEAQEAKMLKIYCNKVQKRLKNKKE
jgi:hypothetical protein